MTRRLSILVVLAVAGMVLIPAGAAAGGGCHAAAGLEMKTSSKPLVMIAGCAFETTVTYIEPGDSVTWVNKDMAPHTVTGAAQSWGTEDLLDQGERVSYTFEDEGVYPYYCALHPSMVGAVVVGDATAAPAAGAVKPVKEAGDAAPVSAPLDDDGGTSPAVLALAAAAALAALVAATRYVLNRRASTASAS